MCILLASYFVIHRSLLSYILLFLLQCSTYYYLFFRPVGEILGVLRQIASWSCHYSSYEYAALRIQASTFIVELSEVIADIET